MTPKRAPSRGVTRAGAIFVGAVAVVLYVAACVATLGLGSQRLRPLFEGFGPLAPYRWVNPPKDFAADNVPPKPFETDIGMGPEGSDQSGAGSEDSQLLLNLPTGAAPPHGADTTMRVKITPLDPATLGPLPPQLKPDGNAYRVELYYQPSGQPVPTIARPGNVFLTVPVPTQVALMSSDGRQWHQLETQAVNSPTIVGATFPSTGYFLAAHSATVSVTKPSRGGSGGGSSVLVPVVLVVALALGLGLTPVVLRRRRGRRRRR